MNSRSEEGKALKQIVGQLYRKLRREKRITQVEVARRMGLKRSSDISEIESGRYSPAWPYLYRMTLAVGVPLGEFLQGVDQEMKTWRQGHLLEVGHG